MISNPEVGQLVQHTQGGRIGRIVALSTDEDGRTRAQVVWLRQSVYKSTSVLVQYLRDWYQNHVWPNNSGSFTKATCPDCGGLVVYNGNYFCENWGCNLPAQGRKPARREGGPCDWAMPHPATRVQDRAVCDQLGVDYE